MEQSEQYNSEHSFPVRKEQSPQVPEIPWDDWFVKIREKFEYWKTPKYKDDQNAWSEPEYPNLPDEFKAVKWDIPGKEEFDRFLQINKAVREARGENSSDVFYRPGIGFGQASNEILQKIGSFGTMIVTDPVYEGKEMVDWSKNMLPIDYYLKTLSILDAKDIKVLLSDDFRVPGRTITSDIAFPKRNDQTIGMV